MDCIFCNIATGKIPSTKIIEDDRTLAFLDINPLAPGHTLIIPKVHAERLEGLSNEDAAALFAAAHRISGEVQRGVAAEALTIGINDGRVAGQEVPHVHVHLIPRFTGDDAGGVHNMWLTRPNLSPEEITKIGERIRAKL